MNHCLAAVESNHFLNAVEPNLFFFFYYNQIESFSGCSGIDSVSNHFPYRRREGSGALEPECDCCVLTCLQNLPEGGEHAKFPFKQTEQCVCDSIISELLNEQQDELIYSSLV